MATTRNWTGIWITGGVDPAPYLRKRVDLAALPRKAVCFLCGLGWHELYVNGTKADTRVLAPVVSQFEKHVSYVAYDVTPLLKAGTNVFAVLLGNGWYNCRTEEVWDFHRTPWLDLPKMICDVECDGKVVLSSDASWKAVPSPILMNQLRNGEEYDALREVPGVLTAGFDDSRYPCASPCKPPRGELVQETAPPCRIFREYAGSVRELSPGVFVCDFGVNLTGWCEITAIGPAGSALELDYAERIGSGGDIDTEAIACYVKSGRFQHDVYHLKGGTRETWHPRFTYHGFRYCRITCRGGAELLDAKAQFVHSDLPEAGHFRCSDKLVNRLHACTIQSFLANYTGIPTDCPHREKNGWTGDAQLALETGLWNFDAAAAMGNFARLLADTQRPSGQLPGIAPTGGWGYDWGSGPAWDVYLFEAPYRIALYTGDDSLFRELLPAMEKYLCFCQSKVHGGLVDFGLGDWCLLDPKSMTPVELTSSAYVLHAAKLISKYKPEYASFAKEIAEAINRKYYRGNGIYADGQRTALACALCFGFAAEPALTARRLAEAVRAKGYRTGFGILGAKFIFRALADHGYAEDAFLLLTCTEFPGYGHWITKLGATTLHENWTSDASQNHVMFGDVAAWMHQYLAGIVPLPETPGFRHFRIRPCFVSGLAWAEADHTAPAGTIRVRWERQDGSIHFVCEIPDGCTADLDLAGRTFPGRTGHVELQLRQPEGKL